MAKRHGPFSLNEYDSRNSDSRLVNPRRVRFASSPEASESILSTLMSVGQVECQDNDAKRVIETTFATFAKRIEFRSLSGNALSLTFLNSLRDALVVNAPISSAQKQTINGILAKQANCIFIAIGGDRHVATEATSHFLSHLGRTLDIGHRRRSAPTLDM